MTQAFLLSVVAYLMFRTQPERLRIFFYPTLLLKLMAGLALGYYYLHSDYEGDTFLYFRDATAVVEVARHDPENFWRLLWARNPLPDLVTLGNVQPRALFFVKVTSVLLLFSGGSYVMLSLLFSFISFCGAWYLVRALTEHFDIREAAVLAFLVFPSVVFWTSGVMKESIAMAALYFLSGVFIKFYMIQRVRLWELITIPIAFFLLWNLKYYFVAVFVPITTTILLMKRLVRPYMPIQKHSIYGVLSVVVFFIPVVVVTQMHPNFSPDVLLQVIVENYYTVRADSPHNTADFGMLTPTAGGILPQVPAAVLAGIFRPYLWEANNAPQTVAALENTMIIMMLFGAMFYLAIQRKRLPFRELVVWTIVYIIILDALLTLSSPNFGTLSRYRVGFLPFLILLLAIPLPLEKFRWKK